MITDVNGNKVISDEATYSLKQEIKITEQPVSQIYVKGQKITSKVVATGEGLKYQWEYRLPKDSGWTKWSAPGNNTAETSYAYPAVFNGIKLRCVITDVNGNKVISDEATYSLKQEIKITEQPVSQIYVKGQKITSKVVATGEGLKYQWEYRLPKDSGWTKWSAPGNNTAETAYAYPAVFNGIKLRCVITDVNGNKVISDEATYSLKQEIKITEQPVSQTYVKGQKITSKVVATGEGLKYQWEYRLPKDSGWTKWSAPGNNTAETAYAYPAVFNGIKLRCVINDIYGNKVISDEIVLRQIENDEWELPII